MLIVCKFSQRKATKIETTFSRTLAKKVPRSEPLLGFDYPTCDTVDLSEKI